MNKAGIYEMIFHIGGVQTSVVVDDYIPVRGDNVAFCWTKTEELWAILMEKAFAKLHGNYEIMAGGLPGMALHFITGFPVSTVRH